LRRDGKFYNADFNIAISIIEVRLLIIVLFLNWQNFLIVLAKTQIWCCLNFQLKLWIDLIINFFNNVRYNFFSIFSFERSRTWWFIFFLFYFVFMLKIRSLNFFKFIMYTYPSFCVLIILIFFIFLIVNNFLASNLIYIFVNHFILLKAFSFNFRRFLNFFFRSIFVCWRFRRIIFHIKIMQILLYYIKIFYFYIYEF
jgi:hypothetical protein